MFIACVEILDQRRSEERNPTRPSACKHLSAPPNAAGGFCSSSYKHATPNGVKPVTIFHSSCRGWDSRAFTESLPQRSAGACKVGAESFETP